MYLSALIGNPLNCIKIIAIRQISTLIVIQYKPSVTGWLFILKSIDKEYAQIYYLNRENNFYMKKSEIQIRDPFILCEDNLYYMYGTTDKNSWSGAAEGFDVYISKDLDNWEGPHNVFKRTSDFWADTNFWAPEVHKYNGAYIMFASFKAENICRGIQILTSNSPLGPFVTLTDKPITPSDWECLDGTLWVENGIPYIVFCHEWTQICDGEICAMPLNSELIYPIGEPVTLFSASQAPWAKGNNFKDIDQYIDYVTDGPFLYKSSSGKLIMLWSSASDSGYAIGQAVSNNGILGQWIQIDKPIFAGDGGHGMLFKTFDEQLLLAIHCPNNTPLERPEFFNISDECGELRLKNNDIDIQNFENLQII